MPTSTVLSALHTINNIPKSLPVAMLQQIPSFNRFTVARFAYPDKSLHGVLDWWIHMYVQVAITKVGAVISGCY